MNTMRTAIWVLVGLALAAIGTAVRADDFTIVATDSGFVTMKGGSSKGDSVFGDDGPSPPSGPFYNYSVGYEIHYPGGFYSPPPFPPMIRKNYFVFDLSGIGMDKAITGAALTLWTGTLESADASETYTIKETPDQPGALFDAGFLVTAATTTGASAFDESSDMAIAVAESFHMKLGAGPATLASVAITHDMDDTFLEIAFTPEGISHLNAARLAGGMVVLGGMVTTVDTDTGTSPQQPFGFTDVGLPGTPLAMATPTLLVTTVPEPTVSLLLVAGLALVTAASRISATRRQI